MYKFYKIVVSYFLKISNKLINTSLALREVQKFVEKIINDLPNDNGLFILDAGAGDKRFAHYFKYFKNYETCDLENENFHKKIKHTFFCDIENIPVENEKYDVVINLQVLEHVKNPNKCINELSRVLKKNGKIYISAPGMFPIHFAPHNYFNFHPSAFKLMLEKNNLKIQSINEQGGAFLIIGVLLSRLPFNVIKNQSNFFMKLIFFIFFLITIPIFHFIFPIIFKIIDKIFITKGMTIGYNIIAKKI